MIEFHEKAEFFGIWIFFIFSTIIPNVVSAIIGPVASNASHSIMIATLCTFFHFLVNNSRVSYSLTTLILFLSSWFCNFKNLLNNALSILTYMSVFLTNVCGWEIVCKSCSLKDSKRYFPILALTSSSGKFIVDNGGVILNDFGVHAGSSSLWIISVCSVVIICTLAFKMSHISMSRSRSLFKPEYLLLSSFVLIEDYANPESNHYIHKSIIDWTNDIEYGVIGIAAFMCLITFFGFKYLTISQMGYLCPVIHILLWVVEFFYKNMYFSVVRKYAKYIIFVPVREMIYMQLPLYSQTVGRSLLSGLLLLSVRLYQSYQNDFVFPSICMLWVALIRKYELIIARADICPS
jgi:hypothetical protein